jgi:hypothetical protein
MELVHRLQELGLGISLFTGSRPPFQVDEIDLVAQVLGQGAPQPGIAVAVTREGSVLRAQITGQTALRILPRSPTEFFYRQVQATIRFAKDGEEVTGLELEQAGRRSKWKKLQQKLR